jgi:predicted ATPase
MIRELRLQEFKCFGDQRLPMANLTLLAGANAAGKSTVIQSLLLLRQSHLRGTLAGGELLLNGPLVNVGTALDAVREKADTDTISFTLTQRDMQQHQFGFDYPRGAGESYILRGTAQDYDTNLSLFAPRFNYLNAERIGPRLLYPMSEMIEDLVDVGVRGEFTAHCLERFGTTPLINPQLALNAENTSTLLFDQTRYRMQQIIPDLDIDPKAITEADQMRIGFRTTTGRFLRPTNIGFGIIYTLPIVVAALLSPEEALLIVENPEAHLHPASQSRIGGFLAEVAAANVQVLIETHSDHVLNGIRLAVRRKILGTDQVSINYFRSNGDGVPEVSHPQIYPDGGIDPWPSGFFDQFEQDLLELL